MQKCRDFQPNTLDPVGLPGIYGDKLDWFVAPVAVVRGEFTRRWDRLIDSLKRKGAVEGEDFEIHRFSHWACGYFDLVIVKPESTAFKVAKRFKEVS